MGLSLSWVWPINLNVNNGIPDDRVAQSMLELVLHLVSRSKLKVLEKIQQGTRYS